jgi:type I site-specific restriction endonuclease
VQWKNIKECVLDTVSDLVGKVEKRARNPWITQEVISKMAERRKWKNVNTEEGRRNYRRPRHELKRATGKARKEYLENIRYFPAHKTHRAFFVRNFRKK